MCQRPPHPGGTGAPSPPQADLAQGCSRPRHSSLSANCCSWISSEGCTVFAVPLWLTALSSSPFAYLIIPGRARISYKYGNMLIIMTTEAHSCTVCGKSRLSPVSVHIRFPPSGGISKLINNIWWPQSIIPHMCGISQDLLGAVIISRVVPVPHLPILVHTGRAHISLNFSELFLWCQSFSFDSSCCCAEEKGSMDTSDLNCWRWGKIFLPVTKHC